ncbi:MAG: DM13 domain-containing protein [Pseudohongiellaceae bacterium]
MKNKMTSTITLMFLMAILGGYSYAQAETVSGEWVKKERKISGMWTIEDRVDGAYLVLDENFKTRKAPDLKFILSNQSIDSVTSKNAMEGAQVVALLQSTRGEQSYKLPDNYTDFSTLLLHCEQYSKLWGGTSL